MFCVSCCCVGRSGSNGRFRKTISCRLLCQAYANHTYFRDIFKFGVDNNNDVCLILMAFITRCTIRDFHCEQIILSLYMRMNLSWFQSLNMQTRTDIKS